MLASDHQLKNKPIQPEHPITDRFFEQTIWKAIVIDRSGVLVRCNRKARAFWDLSSLQTAKGEPVKLSDLFSPSDQSGLDVWVNSLFQTQLEMAIDLSLERNGQISQVRMIGRQLEENKQLAQIVVYELSEQNFSNPDLINMAYYDPLTRLPNRHLLMDRLQRALLDADRHQEKLAILLIDLDHFKRINDTLGHAAGDLILKSVSENMMSVLRESDTLARFGGDEFIVFTRHLSGNHDAAAIAARLLQAIDQPIQVHDIVEQIGGSIGISIFPNDAGSIDNLIQKADIALYRAKESGRSRYTFFDDKMERQFEQQNLFERNLRAAIEQNQICLHYQPIVAANSNRIIALEALLRWNSPTDGLLTAAEFLPEAERIGMDRQLTDWALQASCQQMKHWIESGLINQSDSCRLTVNLSLRQLQSPHIVRHIRQSIEASGLSSKHLVIEIHESDYKNNESAVQKALIELGQMDIQIYLDDFCEGFCQLVEDQQPDFSTIKLSQHMTRRFIASAYGELLLSSMINLAHSAHKKVIAEGVETQAIHQRLGQFSLDAMQGYWLSPPIPPAQIEMLLSLQQEMME